jgi:RNA polymerase sigma-70 factor (ECF subfamily)
VTEDDDALVAAVAGERRHLLALAYRMLGTLADAEEAVQETYVRWYRMDPQDRAAVVSPRAWLTRVAGRVCLDLLGSARARRERYVGEWLPEPLPGGAPLAGAPQPDPADRVTLDESVGSALLVVLERLTPAERVAFVLHDVFGTPFDEIAEAVGRTPAATRQLASSARRKVRAHRALGTAPAELARVTRAFAAAAAGGDLGTLVALLDPAVELRSDGGGIVSAARRPVVGADHVARFLVGIVTKNPWLRVEPAASVDGPVLAIRDGAGAVRGVVSLGVAAGAVVDVWIVMNPEKLGAWTGV